MFFFLLADLDFRLLFIILPVFSPDMRVLKTGQGVVEYLRLEGTLPTDQILNIAKTVLLLSEKKINALYL